jgi:hypothetical protein
MIITDNLAVYTAAQNARFEAGHVLVSHNVNEAGEIELLFSNGDEIVLTLS